MNDVGSWFEFFIMLCIQSAYSNIVKDSEWFKKSLGLALFFAIYGIMCFISAAMNSADTKTLMDAFSLMGLASVSYILSILSALIFAGYSSVYLRNLLADGNSNLPEWNIYLKEMLIAGLKLYVFYFVISFAVVIVALVIGGIFFLLAGLSKFLIPALFVIFLILLSIALCLFYIPLQINFASKNLELSALFDFKSALKYFCKDYYTYLLWIGLFTVGVIILLFIVLIPVVMASPAKSTPYEFMGICYIMLSPVMSLFLLISTNLIAQIYYSRINKMY